MYVYSALKNFMFRVISFLVWTWRVYYTFGDLYHSCGFQEYHVRYPISLKLSKNQLGFREGKVEEGIISIFITWPTHTDRVSRNLIGSKPVCKSPYSPGSSILPELSRAYVFLICAPHKHDKQAQTMWFSEGVAEFRPKNQLFLKNEEDATFDEVCLLLIEGKF